MISAQQITAQGVEALAKSSQIAFDASEIAVLTAQVEQVLEYALRVCSCPSPDINVLQKNSNIFRADVVVPCDAQELLERAPQVEGSYFVVPLILENR